MAASNTVELRYTLPPEFDEIQRTYFRGTISKEAFLLAVLLSWHRDVAPFSFEQIVKMADDAERPDSESTLRRHLAELIDTKCLIVEEVGNSQTTPQAA